MLRIALGLLVLSLSASAATVGFDCVTSNTSTCSTAVAPFFGASISDLGGGTIQFLFFNNHTNGGIITKAFIDEGSTDLFSSFTINPTANTSFSVVTSGTMPGANGNPYDFSTNHGAVRNNGSGGVANGVNFGETLDLRGTLNPGYNFASILANLALGPLAKNSLRIGIHVQSLPSTSTSQTNGASEGLLSFYDPPAPPPGQTPEPATFALVGGALIGLVVYNRRKAQKN